MSEKRKLVYLKTPVRRKAWTGSYIHPDNKKAQGAFEVSQSVFESTKMDEAIVVSRGKDNRRVAKVLRQFNDKGRWCVELEVYVEDLDIVINDYVDGKDKSKGMYCWPSFKSQEERDLEDCFSTDSDVEEFDWSD